MIIFGKARHFLSPKMQTWDELSDLSNAMGRESFIEMMWRERDKEHGGRTESLGPWPLKVKPRYPSTVTPMKRVAQ